MLFDAVIGQEHIKQHLKTSADMGRIPHAQLFVGPEGCGTLPIAIAYAEYLLGMHLKKDINTFDALQHPDLHFAYPVSTTATVKSKPKSLDFIEDWRQFLSEQPYGNLFDWFKLLSIEKKQGHIGVDEAQQIVKTLSLKAYEGGYKIMIVWMAEKLNVSASNKLLKLIEEPPEKTIFILIAEEEEQILQTIRSRCQLLHFNALPEEIIKNALIRQHSLTENEAHKLAVKAHGNYNKALDFLREDSEDLLFDQWFVFWVRSAFKAKGNKAVVRELLGWSEEIAKTSRETQKHFLQHCIFLFRQGLMANYRVDNLVFAEVSVDNFDLKKFSPFVHGNNILPIFEALEKAIYHIERNGNAKIILADLSIQLTRLLHKKT